MKMIEEWASNYFNNDEPDLRETLTDIRNEAFDAAIKTIKEHEIYVDAYNQTLGQAVKAIEELREKK